MAVKTATEEEILQAGMDALFEKLGPEKFVTFIQYFYKGMGDYTKERKEFFSKLSRDEILKGIKELRGKTE